MSGSYLGPRFSEEDIAQFLEVNGYKATRVDTSALPAQVATLLADEKVIGLVLGRMEFGPRALGARSIIGDARSPKMQSVMNLKIKFRESFRPFAPSVLRERVHEWFELDADSPYMLLVADVRPDRRLPLPSGANTLWGIDQLNVPRSTIPAVTHVDYSARGFRRCAATRTRSTTTSSRRSTSGPAVRSSSTRRSTCAASRSSARRRTRTGASCGRTWTRWSLGISSSKKGIRRRSKRSLPSRRMPTEPSDAASDRRRAIVWTTVGCETAVVLAWLLLVLRYQYGVAWLQPYEASLDALFLAAGAGVLLARVIERRGAAAGLAIVLRLALAAAVTIVALVGAEYAVRLRFRRAHSSGNAGS